MSLSRIGLPPLPPASTPSSDVAESSRNLSISTAAASHGQDRPVFWTKPISLTWAGYKFTAPPRAEKSGVPADDAHILFLLKGVESRPDQYAISNSPVEGGGRTIHCAGLQPLMNVFLDMHLQVDQNHCLQGLTVKYRKAAESDIFKTGSWQFAPQQAALNKQRGPGTRSPMWLTNSLKTQ